MAIPQVVLDTNVVVSALRSRRCASYRLLRRIDSGKFEINLSVSLFLEYEDACKRLVGDLPLTDRDVDDILDYLCKVANRRKLFYLWRPFLPDPKYDMVLELAIAGGCGIIVTHNRRDFRGADQFGLRVLSPPDFLEEIGELP